MSLATITFRLKQPHPIRFIIWQSINFNAYYQNPSQRISMILKLDSNINTNSWLSYQPTDIYFGYLNEHNIGADASSNEDIYYSDIVAKTFTAYSSSLYNRSSFVTDYYYVDVTQWIWPRSSPNLSNCNFPLPSFNLFNTYDVQIGK